MPAEVGDPIAHTALMDRLLDLVDRSPLVPWEGDSKIPWNEPAFSGRMLLEHLSQDHDLASRRFSAIERHVAWIHHELMDGSAGRILDLTCGPGLYAMPLACLGHSVVGIDFSPASIAYAQKESAAKGLSCAFHLADIRTAGYGQDYDLVILIYGELNVFMPDQARLILERARRALRPGGKLLLEVSTEPAVRTLGNRPATWRAARRGIFSDSPHLVLRENCWVPDQACSVERWYVVDAVTSGVTQYSATTQAYTEADFRELLSVGFDEVSVHPGLNGDAEGDFECIVAKASS